MTGEFADLMLGYYGETDRRRATPRSSSWPQKQAKKDADHLPAGRPAEAGVGRAARRRRSALPGCNGTDEDVLTYAMFPQVAPKFFANRHEGPKNVGQGPGAEAGRRRRGRRPPAERRRRARSRTPITYDVTLERHDAQGDGVAGVAGDVDGRSWLRRQRLTPMTMEAKIDGTAQATRDER